MESKRQFAKPVARSHTFFRKEGTTNYSKRDDKYFRELNSKLFQFARIWKQELATEYSHSRDFNDSTRLFMDSIGKQMESIALTCCNYFYGEEDKNIFEASGTGSSGYDLINTKTHKGVEVKSCNLIQNVICSCGRRYNPLLTNTCPTCGSSDRTIRKDTRFNIDAKETLRQVDKDIFDRFMFITINSLNSNLEDGEVKLSLLVDTVNLGEDEYGWLPDINETGNAVNFKDIRLEYFRNQVNRGRGTHCNLLPNSFDYYKLCPTRLFEIVVAFNYKTTDTCYPIDVTVKKINQVLTVPKDVLRKKEVAFMDRYIESLKENYPRDYKSYIEKEVTNTSYNSYLFSSILPYRQKSLGKERGDTTINKDKSLMWNTEEYIE